MLDIRHSLMRPPALWLLAAMAMAWPAAAQNEISGPPVMTTVVVPVVGSVTGIDNVQWRTNVELRNEGRTPANVVVTPRPARSI